MVWVTTPHVLTYPGDLPGYPPPGPPPGPPPRTPFWRPPRPPPRTPSQDPPKRAKNGVFRGVPENGQNPGFSRPPENLQNFPPAGAPRREADFGGSGRPPGRGPKRGVSGALDEQNDTKRGCFGGCPGRGEFWPVLGGRILSKKVPNFVPTGRVIKYPTKCAFFGLPARPGRTGQGAVLGRLPGPPRGCPRGTPSQGSRGGL